MNKNRHSYLAGGTYFFTACLKDRDGRSVAEGIDVLRGVYASVVQDHPVTCHAMVVLPDHIHAVWTLPPRDTDVTTWWKSIKSAFSSRLAAMPHRNDSKRRWGQADVRHCQFWVHAIRNDADFQRHVDYCHFDPVKHGLVRRPEDWAFSTVHLAPSSDMILA